MSVQADTPAATLHSPVKHKRGQSKGTKYGMDSVKEEDDSLGISASHKTINLNMSDPNSMFMYSKPIVFPYKKSLRYRERRMLLVQGVYLIVNILIWLYYFQYWATKPGVLGVTGWGLPVRVIFCVEYPFFNMLC